MGNGSARGSRSLSAPPGRTSGSVQSGRGGQTGQWGSAAGRGWDDQDEEEDWSGRARQQRSPSGQQGAGARGEQRRPSGPQRGQARAGGATVRGNWVVETDTKGASSSGSTLRKVLLLSLLIVVVLLGGVVVLNRDVRHRVECYLPGASATCKTASLAGAPATPGALNIQVNVPGATVKVDSQTQTTQAGQSGAFSTTTFKSISLGSHTLTVQAANFSDYSAPLNVSAGNMWVTVWLAPSQTALASASVPAVQPDGGVAGDHYAVGKAATSTISVSISYQISGWPNPLPFTSQLVKSQDTTTSPFAAMAATLALVPVITVTNAAGSTLYTSQYQVLPTTQFGVQVFPTVDAKGKAQLSVQSAVLKAGGQNVTLTFAKQDTSDYTLLYALASILPASPANALNFTCVGAVDSKNFNPEDGLFITEAGGAHYFYRWGLFWGTNAAAHTLTPNVPMAQGSSNEFNDANTAHANNSCGS